MSNYQKILEQQKDVGQRLVEIRQKLNEGKRLAAVIKDEGAFEEMCKKVERNHTSLLQSSSRSDDYFTNNYYGGLQTVMKEIVILIGKIKKGENEPTMEPDQESLVELSLEEVAAEDRTIDLNYKHQKALSRNEIAADRASEVGEQYQRVVCHQDEGEGRRADGTKKLNTGERVREKFFALIKRTMRKINDGQLKNVRLVEMAYNDLEFSYRRVFNNEEDDANVEDQWEDIKDCLESLRSQLETSTEGKIRNGGEAVEEVKSHVRLAEIRIPEFDGNIDEWESFHDLFKNLIHDSPHYSNVEKMYRLKAALRGEARQLLQHLKVTEVNYTAAFDLLKQRYENKRLLFTKLVDSILDQPIMDSDSAGSIKQMLDTTNNSMQALNSMNMPTSDATPFIARILVRKFDKNGLRLYERQVRKPREVQQLSDVLEFLEQQYLALEAAGEQCHSNKREDKKYNTLAGQQCYFCDKVGHQALECRKLTAMSIEERRSRINNKRICFICLSHKTDKKCNSRMRCKKCDGNHHTLMHMEYSRPRIDQRPERTMQQSNTKSSMVTNEESRPVLLATAQVKARAITGEFVVMRAMIDQGSQITSMSEEAAQILGLPRIRNKTEIHGLGSALVGVSKSKVELEIKPRFLSKDVFRTQALVLPTVMSALPSKSFDVNMQVWDKYILADPLFNKSDRIDLIIGGDLYADIMEEGHKKGDGPFAQRTKLGWILSGKIDIKRRSRNVHVAATNLERFWELEEVDLHHDDSSEDQRCMINYKNTTMIEKDGRTVVRLPLRDDTSLGESKPQAMARFLAGERRAEGNPELKKQYVNFMREYEELGHMVEVPMEVKGKFYLPHQAVVREGSRTTKVRVVFDASARSSNGRSLNDIMYTGPKLQKDIFDIMIKWRLWKYVVTADVEKMYRQIKVKANDQEYQYIVWRESKKAAMKQYKLTTVTYGTSAAPFLAVRTLFNIADRLNGDDTIKEVIKQDFYMDDLMTGADTVENCKYVMAAVATQLNKYHFNLRKWLSNDREITRTVHDKGNNEVIHIKDDESVKTLGVLWDPVRDEFSFNINVEEVSHVTKRIVLSIVARIFDPLGWLAPVTIVAKLIMQKLWLLQSAWDEPLPAEIAKEWQHFIEDISMLRSIRIPRWVTTATSEHFELHGFSDASEKAYAAVVYMKCAGKVALLTSKSKVNPIKNRKTLPKLELCAAHLLARLLKKVSEIINRKSSIFAWSDSTIALGWITNNRNNDKFIRNRVNDIATLLPGVKWNYVNTKENPADVASRGIQSKNLRSYNLWWCGPEWLRKTSEEWPRLQQKEQQVVVTAAATEKQQHFLDSLWERCSSFTKLQRVVAYIIRFTKAVKGDKFESQMLTLSELDDSERLIILRHQQLEFGQEMKELTANSTVGRKSSIVGLYPFLDKYGIIRVGGRLQNANMLFDQMHPMVLQRSHLATLLVKKYHVSTLHGGNRLTEVTIKRKYWIQGIKKSIKKYIRSCPRCIRYKKEAANQIMGNLPEPRVLASHPFMHTGVDYAGPLLMKCSRGRGQKCYKGYIAVFVCMATKAIHLEAVSDLTTDAFIAALKRFFSRRGKSSHMYSDNGTNFVGARKKIDVDFAAAVRNNKSAILFLTEEKVQWHFIPPAAPHHGGIWEAGVKSVKHHLRRVIGDAKLTYEEMSTLLSQVEAVLNSRPLMYLDNEDLESLDVLTPGHFLIGRPMTDSPEHVDEVVGCLNKWKLIQKMKKDFWNRWKDEYLASLQQRRKWVQPEENLKKGDVVIVKEETTHPSKWPLGRIEEAIPGKDGKVRVVAVKLQSGTFKRPVQKVCPLVKAEEDTLISGSTKEKPSRNIHSMGLFLMLLLMSSVKGGSASAIGGTISQLGNSTAIYLDHIGSVDVVASSWNIVVFFNMQPFFEVISRSEVLLRGMRTTCGKLQDFEDQCGHVLDTMERLVQNMKRTNQYLFPEKGVRAKRAPLEFIGSLQHVLFGTMDADDRRQMETNMRNILDNQHDLKFLVKKQTSVVESTINVLRRSTEEVNENFKSITHRLNNMTEIMKETFYVYRESIKFFMVTKEIQIMIEENEKVQSEIIELLIDINHGKLNPSLLTPAQLQEEINNVREHIPDHLKLPGRKYDQLSSIYKLLTAKATILDDQLVISASIPLFNDRASQLHRIIPIPFEYKGVKMIAASRSNFLIYSFNGDTYHLMSQTELNQCQRFTEDEYVCDGGWPWMDANDDSCEVSSIKPLNKHRCQFAATQLEFLWVKLQTANKWLFSSFNNTTAHIQCQPRGQRLLEMPLQGILSLDPGCTLRVKGALISAPYQLTSERVVEDRMILATDLGKIATFNMPSLGSMTINHTAAIENLEKQIAELKKTNVQLRGLDFHRTHGSVSLVLIIILLIIAVLMYVRFKCKNRQNVLKIDFTSPTPLGVLGE